MNGYLNFLPKGDLSRDIKEYFLMHGSQDTYEHTLDVIEELKNIQKQYGHTESRSLIACYCHDLGSVVKSEDIIEFCLKNNIEISDEEKQLPSILHQKLSCFIAEKVFGITDSVVLKAIRYHTTSRENPSMTEIEVFLSDKMSWKEDGYRELALKIKEVVRESKEKAILYYLSDLDKNSNHQKLYHSDSKKAFEFFRLKYSFK